MGLQGKFHDALHVMTGLAEGADQLVAQEATKLNIGLVTVLPMREERYRLTMTDEGRATFDILNAQSKLTMTLPELPRDVEDGALNHAPRHYRQLAAFLARRSHLLLVLWDGADDPTVLRAVPKPGGTADVVRLRTDMGYAAEVERCSPLFGHSGSPLDALRPGSVVCVSAQRRSGQAPVKPGTVFPSDPGCCFMLRIKPDLTVVPPKCEWVAIDHPVKAIDSVEGETERDFRRLSELNDRLSGIKLAELKVFEQQLKDLGEDTDTESAIGKLKRFQAGADTAAIHYQRRLIGLFSARRIAELPKRYRDAWGKAFEGNGPAPWPNALTIYGLLLPFLVILFEIYSELHGHWGFLAAYFVLSLGAFGFYKIRISRDNWQDNWQDYRALAEALRVQLFWSFCGLPIAAGDNYLRKQDTELGWIKFAAQGPALWAIGHALSAPMPNRSAVMDRWVDNQVVFFIGPAGKAKLNSAAADRNKFFAQCAYLLGLLAALVLIVNYVVIAAGWSGANCLFSAYSNFVGKDGMHEALNTIAVTMPAVAAYLTLMTNLRAYDAHARSYWQMGTAFRRAHTIAKSIPESATPEDAHTRAFKLLMRELGRESLAETAEWLMDHRDRRVEPT